MAVAVSSGMSKPEQSEPSSERRRRNSMGDRANFPVTPMAWLHASSVALGALGGVAAGAVSGVIAGPPGILAGALLGGAIGSAAGWAMGVDQAERRLADEEHDRVLVVNVIPAGRPGSGE